MASAYRAVMDIGPNWFHSPPPTRGATPLPQQHNPYLDLESADEQFPTGYPYRSRIRPDRLVVTDPEHFTVGNLDESLIDRSQRNSLSSRTLGRESQTHRDAETQYPKDEPGEEMSELARVWRIYIDEAHKFDSSLTEGCSRGIDVLLVFTGLFSAVLTTFIIESFQLMIPDAGETTNILLERLIAIQTNFTRVEPVPDTSLPSLTQMHWVNGLWFAALACSLSTALISMLAKQWLQAYIPNVSGSPRQRARQRQSRYMELQSWHVLAIVNALPLLLHVALLLFFAGVIVLMWSVNIAITLATWIIVAFAYAFYTTSIWLPIFYPNCPYQHPISDHLRRLIHSFQRLARGASRPLSPLSEKMENDEVPQSMRLIASPDDRLDASILVWMFTQSTDKSVTTAGLQAIAGLPRDFSGTHILRAAGAIQLVEQGFQSCFDKDTTDMKWHLTHPDAWLYCKAWMNLTRGTKAQWPLELLDPLWKLQDLKAHVDGAAIASCAVAVSSVDSHLAQWELLAYLTRHVAGEVHLSPSTLCWVLDSMIEGLIQWEMPIAVIEKTTVTAVPVLLRLLQLMDDMPASNVRSAAGLALYIFICGPVDLAHFRSEEHRRAAHCEIMLKSLSTIAGNPERFGVEDTLLDVTAHELSKLASPIIAHSHRFSTHLRDVARVTLFELFIAGRLGVGIMPDSVLADVLHLLNQIRVAPERHPLFVKVLVKTLLASSHQDITSWSVRLLKPLLSGCSDAVVEAFTESNGINAVLRAAKAGDIDNRRLQVDSWRTLCAFLISSTALYRHDLDSPPAPTSPMHQHLDAIFHSDFFETLCAVIVSRRWWLLEVNGQWVSTLVDLCRLRPHEPVWRKVIKVVKDTHRRGRKHDGMAEIMDQLDVILQRSPSLNEKDLDRDGDGGVDDAASVGTVTMMEQRLAVSASSAMVVVPPATSAWFGP